MIDNLKKDISDNLSRIPLGGGMVEVSNATSKVGSSSRLRFTGATVTNDADGGIKIAISGGSVSDDVYGAGWDGDTATAPSKNAVYDKIETMGGGVTESFVIAMATVL